MIHNYPSHNAPTRNKLYFSGDINKLYKDVETLEQKEQRELQQIWELEFKQKYEALCKPACTIEGEDYSYLDLLRYFEKRFNERGISRKFKREGLYPSDLGEGTPMEEAYEKLSEYPFGMLEERKTYRYVPINQGGNVEVEISDEVESYETGSKGFFLTDTAKSILEYAKSDSSQKKDLKL